MNTNKKTARIVGILFLIATATYMAGSGLIDTILNTPDYLIHAYPNRTQIISGVLLQFVDAVAVVGIGIVMFPLLKKHSETIAVGYIATRVIEFVFLVVGGVGSLLLVTVSEGMLDAGAANVPHIQMGGELLMTQRFLGYQIAMLTLGIGSIFFCYLLYASRLIPRAMSVLGLIGYAALSIGAVLELFSFEVGLMFSIPGGLFELILPIWLIVKGFNSTAIAPKSAKTVINARDELGLAQAHTALGGITK